MLQLPLVHHQRPAGAFGRPGVVRHHDNRLAVMGVERGQQTEDLVGGFAVEIARRLIADEQSRVGHDRPGDGDPLLLAAGELVGLVSAPVGEVNQLQRGVDPSSALLAVKPRQQQRQLDVVLCAQDPDQVVELKNEADVRRPPVGEC